MSIRSLRLNGLLSFAPGSAPFDLQALNVLIGPNASGKSNLIEAIDLLAAAPRDLPAVIRDGGGPREWLWKGGDRDEPAEIETVLDRPPPGRPLRHRIKMTAVESRVEVVDEAIEELQPGPGRPPEADVYFYYRFQQGHPVINIHDGTQPKPRHLKREDLLPDQSVLAQRQDPELYPEVTWVGRTFRSFHIFREWTFGRYAPLRYPQPATLPDDALLPDNRNLALVLNQIEHTDGTRLNDMLQRFFPRFERLSTRISGGTVQFYLHESGFSTPIPATRLSDGTIRFVALLASLLSVAPPPLLCIEEPELGLHPDAVAHLADLLLEASDRMQLVVTTHSEALVGALNKQPDAIVVCERPGAATELRRLDPDQISRWLEDYGLGDLWRMGELGANP